MSGTIKLSEGISGLDVVVRDQSLYVLYGIYYVVLEGYYGIQPYLGIVPVPELGSVGGVEGH